MTPPNNPIDNKVLGEDELREQEARHENGAVMTDTSNNSEIDNNKLLTDLELHDEITCLRKIRGNHIIDESTYTDMLIALINNQKHLYAEYVIGENDTPMNPSGNAHKRTVSHRNSLRSEQRQRNQL